MNFPLRYTLISLDLRFRLRPRTGSRSRSPAPRCPGAGIESLETRCLLAANIVPFDQTFQLASLQAATKTIYLDFNGHVATGAAAAAWGSATDIRTPPFSSDADPAFSTDELTTIQHVWAKVAEDFAPFQVNVTTREPAVADLINSGSGDFRWGIRVVIGDGSKNPSAGAGGIALIGSFTAPGDVPCFVNTTATSSGDFMAIAASHEVGHTLGLGHDSINGGGEYYNGHGGSGSTSWGPIMGAPYSRNLSQWSNGEYAAANNNEDDLAIITSGANGFGYRPDDRANTFAGATPLTQSAGQSLLRNIGIIERNTDSDMYSFTVTTGQVDLRIRPLDVLDATNFTGANLDVGATLYDSRGVVVADIRPQNRLDAQFRATLVGGNYFVRVFGTGNGDPLVDGYSNYGSLGQYTVTVSQTAVTSIDPPIVSIAAQTAVTEGAANRLTAVSFVVTLSKPSANPVTVNYSTRDGSATLLDSDYQSASGTLTFAPGETTKTISVNVVGDTRYEANETFSVELTSPGNATLGRAEATAAIINDDRYVPPTIYAAVGAPPGSITEGNAAVFTISLSEPATSSVQVGYRTVSGSATAGRDFTNATGFVTFAPGETTKTVSVSTINDSLGEAAEWLTLQLVRRPGPAQIGTGSARATIAESDGGVPGRSTASIALAAAFSTPQATGSSSKKQSTTKF